MGVPSPAIHLKSVVHLSTNALFNKYPALQSTLGLKCNYTQRVRTDKLTMASEVVRKHTPDSLKTTKAARQTQVKGRDVQAHEGTKRQRALTV